MEELKPGWQVKGTYNEACAAEGHCPYYFGRDVEGGCRYFMVFRIKEGKVNDVDLSGLTVIYNGDILYPKYVDFMKKGSEGGVYVSDNATEEQRKVLDSLVSANMGALFMKKISRKWCRKFLMILRRRVSAIFPFILTGLILLPNFPTINISQIKRRSAASSGYYSIILPVIQEI